MAEHELDPESVDRAFAEMMATYHLTSDRPDPLLTVDLTTDLATDLAATDGAAPDLTTTDRAVREQATPEPPTPPEPGPTQWRVERSWAEDHPRSRRDGRLEPEPVEAYVPAPLPPLSRPGLPVLIGWIGIGFAALVVLAAGFGLALPSWLAWLAVGAFVIGFGLLLTQLPRHRPPDAGDGAVL